MTPKRYLSQIYWLEKEIEHRLEDISEYRSKIESVKAIAYDKDLVQTSPSGDSLSNAVAKMADMIADAGTDLDEYIEVRTKIVKQIEGIDDTRYSELLYKRYVLHKNLITISEEMNYEYDTIKHMHGSALFKFGQMYLDTK